MAANIITLQALIDAQEDAHDLELIMNEAAWVEVQTRLGRKCYSIHTIQALIDDLEDRSELALNDLQDAIDIAAAAGAGANGWTDLLIQMESGNTLRKEWKDKFDRPSILGQCGISIISDRSDAHYGWGGIVCFNSGKWVHICRKAAGHGTLNNAQLVAIDSYDKGQTWVNERVILTSTQHDLRPDPPKLMANNRGGFMVNRASDGNGHFSPLFLYSDDSGVTWQQKVVTTTSPYTFSSTGGMLDFPASVGGNDTQGFISFGFLSANGLDALYTVDNGETWQQKQEVATVSGDLKALSEWGGCRLGNTDRWIFAVRSTLLSTNTWNQQLTVFTTNNPLNWGSATITTFGLGGNPPCLVYDAATDTVNLLNISRGGRAVPGVPENCIAYAQIDADTAYTSKLVLPSMSYEVLYSLPHWATGYLAPFKVDGRWFTSLTCGEQGYNGGGNSIQVLIGDYISTAASMTKFVDYMNKQLKNVNYIEIKPFSDTANAIRINDTAGDAYSLVRYNKFEYRGITDFTFDAGNASTTRFKFPQQVKFGATADGEGAILAAVAGATNPAIACVSTGISPRKNIVFRNANGEAGSIEVASLTTSYNTTSDETLKDFDGVYDAEKAIEIIKSDPVRNYTWKQSGEKAVGWGAQTSYAIDNTLAVKGGWFLDGVEVPENTEGATYVAWGMDYSKRVPYLWTAVSHLVDEVQKLKNEIEQLKVNSN